MLSERIAPGREHGFDILRAAAILSVFAFHALDLGGAPSVVVRLFEYGWVGVDLFFVLSGFLIARQVFQAHRGPSFATELREFWTKRWMRTLPLYFFVLTIFVAVKPFITHYQFLGTPWRYATFTQNFSPMRDFLPSWSLCVEEHFYLIFPFVAIGVARRFSLAPAAWLLPIAVSITCRWFTFLRPVPSEQLWPALAWPTHVHLDGIAIGVFVASTERTWMAWARRRSLIMLGLALLVTTGALLGPSPASSLAAALFTYPLISCSFALILIGIRGVVFPHFVYFMIYRIAVLSYGAYLWLSLGVRVVDHLGTRAEPWLVKASAFLLIAFVLAAITRSLVEAPALRVRGWLLARQERPYVAPQHPPQRVVGKDATVAKRGK